jgi:hypothetical protein
MLLALGFGVRAVGTFMGGKLADRRSTRYSLERVGRQPHDVARFAIFSLFLLNERDQYRVVARYRTGALGRHVSWS